MTTMNSKDKDQDSNSSCCPDSFIESCPDGLIIINKPVGMTSFQVVGKVRRLLKKKKAGHAGTLDKAAEGLLLICLGRSTKLLKFLFGQDKRYLATIELGKQTSTDDREGSVVEEYSGSIEIDRVEKELTHFRGKIKQVPPDYSAVHVDGQRAYKIAHKQKEKPLIKEREIEIYSLELVNSTLPHLLLDIRCSTGTYIRSIARDLGIKTGYYGYLAALLRSEVGLFSLKESSSIEDLERGNYKIIAPFDILDLPALEALPELVGGIKNGHKPDDSYFIAPPSDDGIYKVHSNGSLLAVVKKSKGKYYYDLVY